MWLMYVNLETQNYREKKDIARKRTFSLSKISAWLDRPLTKHCWYNTWIETGWFIQFAGLILKSSLIACLNDPTNVQLVPKVNLYKTSAVAQHRIRQWQSSLYRFQNLGQTNGGRIKWLIWISACAGSKNNLLTLCVTTRIYINYLTCIKIE